MRRLCRGWAGSGGRMRLGRRVWKPRPTVLNSFRGRISLAGATARGSTPRRLSCTMTATISRAPTTWKASTGVFFRSTSTMTVCRTTSIPRPRRRLCRLRGTRARRGRRRLFRPTPQRSPPWAAMPRGRPRVGPTSTGGLSRSALHSMTGARGLRFLTSAVSP